jgi:hypothetical protein
MAEGSGAATAPLAPDSVTERGKELLTVGGTRVGGAAR